MIKNILNRLRCSNCNRSFLNKDRVFLDEYNTVLHQRCYNLDTLTIKDKGTYLNIISKYDFFNELV